MSSFLLSFIMCIQIFLNDLRPPPRCFFEVVLSEVEAFGTRRPNKCLQYHTSKPARTQPPPSHNHHTHHSGAREPRTMTDEHGHRGRSRSRDSRETRHRDHSPYSRSTHKSSRTRARRHGELYNPVGFIWARPAHTLVPTPSRISTRGPFASHSMSKSPFTTRTFMVIGITRSLAFTFS